MALQISGSYSSGHVAYFHDRRLSHKNNVDETLYKYNETIIDDLKPFYKKNKTQEEIIDDYINHKMQPVIDEYNKGKKPSRQIKVPYTEYREQNNNLKGSPKCYEMVLQIGEHETIGKEFFDAIEGNPEEADKINKAYKKTYKNIIGELQEKFPHMKIVGAFYHADEPGGTPHCHLLIIPFGEPQKGLPQQVSIGRALTNDGIERVKDRKEAVELGGFQLTKYYNKCLEKIIKPQIEEFMKDYNPNIDFKLKEEQHGKKHQQQDEYKANQELKAKNILLKEENDRLVEDSIKKADAIIKEAQQEVYMTKGVCSYYEDKIVDFKAKYDEKKKEYNTLQQDVNSLERSKADTMAELSILSTKIGTEQDRLENLDEEVNKDLANKAMEIFRALKVPEMKRKSIFGKEIAYFEGELNIKNAETLIKNSKYYQRVFDEREAEIKRLKAENTELEKEKNEAEKSRDNWQKSWYRTAGIQAQEDKDFINEIDMDSLTDMKKLENILSDSSRMNQLDIQTQQSAQHIMYKYNQQQREIRAIEGWDDIEIEL